MRLVMALLLVPLTSGCVARAAFNTVTAPISVISKTADVLTTSRSEADEKRGRALRVRDERLGKLTRQRDRAERDCSHSADACDARDRINAEIDTEMRRVI